MHPMFYSTVLFIGILHFLSTAEAFSSPKDCNLSSPEEIHFRNVTIQFYNLWMLPTTQIKIPGWLKIVGGNVTFRHNNTNFNGSKLRLAIEKLPHWFSFSKLKKTRVSVKDLDLCKLLKKFEFEDVCAKFKNHTVFPLQNLPYKIFRLPSGSKGKLKDGEFIWNTDEQGVILAAFFYGYSVLTIPGGILATRFGGKWVNGGALLMAGILTFLTPSVAQLSVPLLVAFRICIGIVLSATFPAMQCIVSYWIPPCERSKMPVFIFTGSAVGTVLCFAMSGFLISAFGWPSLFYITGGLSVIWFVLWATFVTNAPAQHRWISTKEKEFIFRSIEELKHKKHSKRIGFFDIPWKHMFTSLPVWSIFITHFCMHAGMVVASTMIPTYFRTIHGMDIRKNGLLTCLPSLCFFIIANLGSQVADMLRGHKILSTTHVRKLFNCSGAFLAGLFILLVSPFGCNTPGVILCLVLSFGVGGLAISGFGVNTLDIAPQFAGVLTGCSITIGNIAGFIVPSLVGAVTRNNETLTAWRNIFYIFTSSYWFASLVYLIFGSGVV